MPSIIIDSSIFDDYFKSLYKFHYKYYQHWNCRENKNKINDPSDEDYLEMEKIQIKLRDTIEEYFIDAIKHDSNQSDLKESFHRLNYFNDEPIVKTKWIQTKSTNELYYYLLFVNNNDTLLSECIDYWFDSGDGYYPHHTKLDDLAINRFTNINIIDPVGTILKNKLISSNLHDELSEEDIQSIFTFENNVNGINKKKFAKYLDDINIKFPNLPTRYDSKNMHSINLSEVFNIFFLHNTNKNFNLDNNQHVHALLSNKIWIESVNIIDSNLIILRNTANKIVLEITEPIDFIKEIKKQLETLHEESNKTDDSKDLEKKFIEDLNEKIKKFLEKQEQSNYYSINNF